MSKSILGTYLVEAGVLTEEQIEFAEGEQIRFGNDLPRTLFALELMDEAELVPHLGRFMKVPPAKVTPQALKPQVVRLLDEDFCRQARCIAIGIDDSGQFIDVAMTTIEDQAMFDAIQAKTGRNVRPFLAGPKAIEAALAGAFKEQISQGELDELVEPPRSRIKTAPAPMPRPRVAPKPTPDPMPRPRVAPKPTPDPMPRPGPARDSRPPLAEAPEPWRSEIDRLRWELKEVTKRTDRFLYTMARHLAAKGLLLPDLVEGKMVPYPGGRPPVVVPGQPAGSTAGPTPMPRPRPRTAPKPTPDPMPRPRVAPKPTPDPMPRPRVAPKPTPDPMPRPRVAPKPTPDPMPVTPPLPPPDPEDESGEIMVDVEQPQQMKAEDFSGEMVIDRPPRDTDEEPVVAAPPAASRGGVVTSDGAGSAVASGEIKSAPTADPSAPSSVLLEVPDVAAEPVVALDFGTTRSSVAILVANQVQVLRLPTVAVMQLPGGEWDMPSCVGLREDGSVVLGQSAREMLATDPGNVVMSPKRLLGRRHDDREIQGLIAGSAVPTTSGPNGEVMLHLRGQESTVIQICAHVLTLLKLIAEKNLGRPVKKAVMSIPVTFMAEQREALKRAASLADLEIVSFIDEPVAAAVANLYDSHFRGKVAIYDLGGGTFDFAVVERISSGVQLLAKGGDPWLGGDDIDDALARAAANAFWHSTKIELHNKATEWQRLLVAAELAKRELSLQPMTVLRLPGVAQTAEGIHDLEFAINRSQFARLIREAIDRSLETCQQTLEVAGLRTSDIDAVFVSGGSTHIPAVQQALVEFFGKVPRSAVPPERAVLVGSALTHAFLSGAMKA